ncbi:MAG: hypothetical protein PQJ49_06250 [Sphaerochaetaceae bacterium]|nr:hypothetical protein [Sphaerochaetaceae bacterium]
MAKTFHLEPLNRKSFYGKAVVTTDNNISTLRSYETDVATYNHETNEMKVKGWYSATTMRHINAFLDHFGFDTCTKKQLEEQYLRD